MKIFIDSGTHFGEGLKAHVSLLNIDETWKIYCFEANPFTFDYLNLILKKK